MANNTQGYVWRLDTSTVNYSFATGTHRIGIIRVVAASATAGQTYMIEDTNHNRFWESVASGQAYVEESHLHQLVTNPVLASLTTGVIYLTIDKNAAPPFI